MSSSSLSETPVVACGGTPTKRKLVPPSSLRAPTDISPSKRVRVDSIDLVANWMTNHFLGVEQETMDYGLFLVGQLHSSCEETVLVRRGACVYVISAPTGSCPCGCGVPAQTTASCAVANAGADWAKQCLNCDSLVGPAMCFMADVLRSRPSEVAASMTDAQAVATAEFCQAARQIAMAGGSTPGMDGQRASVCFADLTSDMSAMTAALAGALAKHTPFYAFWRVLFGYTLSAVATSNENLAGWVVASAAGALLGRLFSPGEHVTFAELAPALVRAATAPTLEERWSSAMKRPSDRTKTCAIRRVRRNNRDNEILARTALQLQHTAGWKRQLVDFVLRSTSVTHMRRQQLESATRSLTLYPTLLVSLSVVPAVPAVPLPLHSDNDDASND